MLSEVKLLSSHEASSDDHKHRGGSKSRDSILAFTPSSVEPPLGKEGGAWVPWSPQRSCNLFSMLSGWNKAILVVLPSFSFNDQSFLLTLSVWRQILSPRSSGIPNIWVEAKVGDGSGFCWTRERVRVTISFHFGSPLGHLVWSLVSPPQSFYCFVCHHIHSTQRLHFPFLCGSFSCQVFMLQEEIILCSLLTWLV